MSYLIVYTLLFLTAVTNISEIDCQKCQHYYKHSPLLHLEHIFHNSVAILNKLMHIIMSGNLLRFCIIAKNGHLEYAL